MTEMEVLPTSGEGRRVAMQRMGIPPEASHIALLEFEQKSVLTPEERAKAQRKYSKLLQETNKVLTDMKWLEMMHETPMDKIADEIDPIGAGAFLMRNAAEEWREKKKTYMVRKNWLEPRAHHDDFWYGKPEDRTAHWAEYHGKLMVEAERREREEREREEREIARRKAAEEQQHRQNQTPFPWA